ncbi:Fe(3+) dicitrate ABC transporter substrate-binding protein [Marinomonas epiphytica]
MTCRFIRLLACFTLLLPSWLFATTVEGAKGTFTLDYVPKRIVVLEYSFVDALAIVDSHPIGIADDNDKLRILPKIRDIIGPWTSVGTRSQPSLEVISSLQPDLIIADIDRHEGVYPELQKIAPTLMLRSRRESYLGHLEAAEVIGKVINKEAEMTARLAQHQGVMSKFAQQLPDNIEVQFGIALDDYLSLHPGKSYVGTLIQALGMRTPEILKNESGSVHTGLEQLFANNPEHLIIGHYYDHDITQKWQQSPLWTLLQAVKKKQVYHIQNPGTWSRSRGIIAAEIIAEELVALLKK